MADINGGKFGEGLTVGAINEILIGELTKLTKKDANDKNTPLLSSEQIRWISAIVGGNAGQGGSIADSATRNNWLTHVHNILTEELKDKVSEEELNNMKLGNKDADRLTLQFLDSEGHSMPPAETYYSSIRNMVINGEITQSKALEYIDVFRRQSLVEAEKEFVKRLEYAINYNKQGKINDSAAYWFGSAVHVVQDMEAHWRLGEDGGWGAHALGFIGLAPSPDDPKYLPERLERSKMQTAQAWSIYQKALATGFIDREETKKYFLGTYRRCNYDRKSLFVID